MTEPDVARGPLAGVRVVDLTRALAGPYCTMLMGDQGAEVLKIERPGRGDDMRQQANPKVGGENTAFLSTNRNKKSLELDLTDPRGVEAVRRLVAESDVFVENFRPGKADAMGLGWSELHELNPRLIYCSISGYGADGPRAGQAGYAATAEAIAGIMSMTGPRDGPPVRIGVSIIDNLAGVFAKDAITSALLARERTGRGQKIETSLLECAVSVLSVASHAYLLAGVVPERMGSEHQWNVPWKTFETSDGHIVIAGSSEEQWQKFCHAIDRTDLMADDRFLTMPLRAANRDELYKILDFVILQRTSAEWLDVLAAAGAAGAPVNRVDQVFAEPQVLHREMLQSVTHETLGEIAQVGHAAKLSETPAEIRLPPPVLGRHTDEVLREVAGYTDAELARLHDR